MLPFYAFVGKLHTLLETVAVGIHLMCKSFIGSAELFIRLISAEAASAYIGRRDINGGTV
jgi:hypothetical protein